MKWALRSRTGDREPPAPDRQVIAVFTTDGLGRARVRLLANLLGLTVLAALLSIGFGWAVILEPTLLFRALAAAVIVLPLGFATLSVAIARRTALRRPPNRVVISTWGVEFDAPERRPDLAPPESGGALAWSHIGRAELRNDFWAMKRVGLYEVRFSAREFRRGPHAMAVPTRWPWGIVVPYLRKSDAVALLKLSQERLVDTAESGPRKAPS